MRRFETRDQITAAGYRPGWHGEPVREGDTAVVYARGGWREGRVTKVTRLEVQVDITTPTSPDLHTIGRGRRDGQRTDLYVPAGNVPVPFKPNTLATLGDGPHATYVRGLVERVRELQADGGAKANVAAMAVRGIVTTKGVEWAVLVETFGIPTTSDWAMAQRAYGPTKGLPGLS